ncbi:MAG: CBS domain-containing protein [Alphaproteobacteria bacterium]
MKQEPHIKVGEVISGAVHTIDSMATIRKAMTKMAKHKISSLVVERREDEDEYGLITVADIAREVVARNLSFDRVQVYEVMSKPVISVHPDMDLRYAIRLLVRFGLKRALAIGDDRQVLGMVTLRDMVLRYAGQRETETRS